MKVFLISHIADLDGVMPVILTDLTFEDYDYKLLDIGQIDDYMINSLDNNLFDSYDKVFMTDLNISEEVADRINNSDFKNKFQVLDHHIGKIGMNKYDFIKVVDEVNGIKESGASLYYQYLLENYPNDLLKRESVNYMVSLVRLGDTWQWKTFDVPEARDIGTVLSYYGNDDFINYYSNFLRKNREFYFTPSENAIIKADKTKKELYIENMKEKMVIRRINNHNVGIVFAENYRSELGNDLAEYFINEIDLVMIINLNRSISFRCVRDDVDLSEFARYFNGTGHKKASGAPLIENTRETFIDMFLEMYNK